MDLNNPYRLLICIIVPQLIVWVASLGADGILNLAPFSFFSAIGGALPTIMVSVEIHACVPRDILRNDY